jgi:hypothetical protein
MNQEFKSNLKGWLMFDLLFFTGFCGLIAFFAYLTSPTIRGPLVRLYCDILFESAGWTWFLAWTLLKHFNGKIGAGELRGVFLLGSIWFVIITMSVNIVFITS